MAGIFAGHAKSERQRELLLKAEAEGHKWKEATDPDDKVRWGLDMHSEHEKYLSQVVFKKPVIVYNYPKAIKSFYMRENDPGTDDAPGATVAAMDILVPGVGELVGGSQREERHDELLGRIKEKGLDVDTYQCKYENLHILPVSATPFRTPSSSYAIHLFYRPRVP